MNWEVIQAWIDSHQPNGAEKLGGLSEVSKDTLYRIKKTGKADLVTAKKLARVLGISLDVLCGMDHDQKPPAA